MPYIRRDYITSTVARCIYAFITGGSMKAYGVLTEFIVRRLNIPHCVIGCVLSLQQSVGYLAGPFISLLIDKFGVRAVAIFGGFLFGLGYIGQAFYNERLYCFVLFCTLSGFGCGCVSFPTYLYLHRVYGNRFGLVQSLTSQFLFVGVCVVPLFFSYLWQDLGLKGALLVFGAFCWNYMVAGAMTTSGDQRRQRTYDREEQCRDKVRLDGRKPMATVAKCLELITRRKTILCLLLIDYCHFACYFSWALFLIPVAERRGIERSSAVLLSTAGGVGGIFGRFACTALFALEYTNTLFNFLLPNVVQSLAFLGIALSNSLPALLIFSCVSGLTLGFTDGVLPGYIPRKMSKEDIPIAFSIHFIVYAIGMESGTFIAGLFFDYYGTYTASFIFLAITSMVASGSAIVWQFSEYQSGGRKRVDRDESCLEDTTLLSE